MEKIHVATQVQAPLDTVWECWTQPQHITGWAFASDDWECPYAENDLQVDGTFTTTMAAKDGSMKFDVTGRYTLVNFGEKIEHVMPDGREVIVTFTDNEATVTVDEWFDAEEENSRELQLNGWQSILDNFKKYVESR